MGAWFSLARRLLALFVGLGLCGSALGQELDWLWKAPIRVGPVSSVAYTPDGAYLATGHGGFNSSSDPSVRIWDIARQRQWKQFNNEVGTYCTSLAVSPTVIRAWRTDTWSLDQSYAGTRVNAISISQDGCLLGIAGRDATGVAFLHRPSISGHINLSDYTASPSTQPVTLDFLIDGLVYETTNITLNSDGDFSTTAKTAPGEYEVKARASHWLTKSLGTVTISRTTTGINADLINGDVNADNMIDIADYAVLSSAYGSSIGDPLYVANADLNGSGQVNIDDYNILANNYGLSGD